MIQNLSLPFTLSYSVHRFSQNHISLRQQVQVLARASQDASCSNRGAAYVSELHQTSPDLSSTEQRPSHWPTAGGRGYEDSEHRQGM
mmetsp:Transcript_25050/g.30316  ORF Transcript_25050/g.30316 Transcript_25050/m.30316 type:complete len:87 (+) Transcript_25050:205-465(+)